MYSPEASWQADAPLQALSNMVMFGELPSEQASSPLHAKSPTKV
jgi:hypothetical protein